MEAPGETQNGTLWESGETPERFLSNYSSAGETPERFLSNYSSGDIF